MKEKVTFYFDFCKRCFFVFLLWLTFFLNFQTLNALSVETMPGIIIEELRLSVPSMYKKTWIDAEREIWEPWLSKQEGFLGRNIFYNEEKGEALILVNWKTKKLWKNISSKEVAKIQSLFEENIKKSLKIDSNPFKLIYEGELYQEG